MQIWTFLFLSVCGVCVSAGYVPPGFVPLPPLPVNNAPATKKPTTTKAPYKPPVTKAPWTPRPTLPPVTQAPTLGPTQAPTLAPTQAPPLVPTQAPPQPPQNCNNGINVQVPSSNCNQGSGVSNAVQQVLINLKKQLDQSRQQNQASNTAVQAMITQLQSRQSGYLTKISDLQNEVAALVQAFNQLSMGSRPSSTSAPSVPQPTSGSSSQSNGVSALALQQAIQAVRQDMSTAVTDFNNRVFNMTAMINKNEQNEIQVHQSIESQIQKQASDIGMLSQQIMSLNTILMQFNVTGTGSSAGTSAPMTSGATPADIAKLQAQITQIENDIKAYDQKQSAQYASLNQQVASLVPDVKNHSSELSVLRSNMLVNEARLRNVEKNVTVVHDALANFRRQVMPDINQVKSDISDLNQNVSSIKNSVSRIDKSVLNFVIKIGQDESQLKGLTAQATQLRSDVSQIQSDLNTQNGEIATIRGGMLNLKNAIPVNDLNTMNNIILQALSHPNQTLTSSQLQNLTQAITAITNKLGQLNPPSG